MLKQSSFKKTQVFLMISIFGNTLISQEISTIHQKPTNLPTLELDFTTQFQMTWLA